jgi:tRNA threonylcarbamoyladenosine biosynthesis protein TsaE
MNFPFTEYYSRSVEETKKIGQEIAKKIKKGQIVAFVGGLGAGKTSLIKGIASQINSINEDEISSPTFTYLNIYPGNITIYHFDLYRIKDERQFLSMGFEEYFGGEGISLIEWSEKITSLLPSKTLVVHLIEKERENERQITVLEL